MDKQKKEGSIEASREWPYRHYSRKDSEMHLPNKQWWPPAWQSQQGPCSNSDQFLQRDQFFQHVPFPDTKIQKKENLLKKGHLKQFTAYIAKIVSVFIIVHSKQRLTISSVVISTWFVLEFWSIFSACSLSWNSSSEEMNRRRLQGYDNHCIYYCIKISILTIVHSKQILTVSFMLTSTGFLPEFWSIFSSGLLAWNPIFCTD